MNPGKRQIRTDCMTMGRLEFDGDSHTSVRYFLGMTRSDGSANSQFTDLLRHSDKHIKKWLSFQSSTDCGTKAMGLSQELKMAAGDLLPALRTGRFLSDRSGSLFGSTGKVTPRPQVSRNGRFFFLTPSSHPDSRRLRWTRSARPPFPGSDPMSGWHLPQDPGRRPDRYTASAGY